MTGEAPGPAAHAAGGSRSRADNGAHEPARSLLHAAAVFGLGAGARRVLGLLLDRIRDGRASAMRVGELVAELGGNCEALEALEPHAPLVRWRLAAVGAGAWLDRPVTLDDSFWPRLLGHWPGQLPAAVSVPADALDALVLPDAVRAEATAAAVWMRRMQRWSTVVVHGRPGSGRGALAEAIAAHLELPFLRVAGAQLAVLGAQTVAREAIWQQAAVVVDRAEDAEPAAVAALATLLPAPLVVTTTGAVRTDEPFDRPARRISAPALDHHARAALWARALDRAGLADAQVDVPFFAGRFRFGPAQIEDAVGQVREGGDARRDAVFEVCRAMPNVEIGGLAQRVERRHDWADLVVPARVRRELELIVTCGRDGAALFDGAGPGGRARATRGVACLFWGPPGTGKTLAAQVVAGALDRELYRVDLAQVVDKYLGETEKRLDRLFREAEIADAVLLFDEADTVFTRRTEVKDARDRYANLETGYMLQRLEDHGGVCILASNSRNSLDSAFQRRLLFVVELPLPAAPERAGIWRALLPVADIADLELAFLVDRFAMSGGDIRNAVVTATLLARRDQAAIGMRHLVIAGWRELTKAGRLIDLRELEPWSDAIRGFVAEAL